MYNIEEKYNNVNKQLNEKKIELTNIEKLIEVYIWIELRKGHKRFVKLVRWKNWRIKVISIFIKLLNINFKKNK